MSKVLYFDCFAGASGDMVLGALIDAGLPLGELESALGSLMIPGYRLAADRVLRSGLSATKFRVIEPQAPGTAAPAGGRARDRGRGHDHADHHPHGHDHEHPAGHDSGGSGHGEHGHRSLSEIAALIDRSSLSARAKARAVSLFRRLAEAEAEIHQMPVERVHLHEVGALDSIIDIVGAAFAMEWFGPDRVIASALNVGGGMVHSAHGVFPVPAPATVKLLVGVPVYSSGVQAETVTPTGALLVSDYAAGYGPIPAMRVDRVGYGAGDRDLPGTPNVLRVLVGEEAAALAGQRVVMLECEIDDMNPQIFGVLMDRLYAAGALEVFYTPVQMKKSRPGTLVSVVASPDRRGDMMDVLFRETTTIGLRYQELDRACLDRELVAVETPVGPVRFKIARRDGEVLNASPEFEDCARLAAERGLPVKEVQAEAVRAYRASRRP